MAENVQHIRQQGPGGKMVLWAHNGHIEQTGGHLGQHLDEALGEDYLSIGFAFYDGKYSAVGSDGLTAYPAQTAPLGTYEYLFHELDAPIFALDLRQLDRNEPLPGDLARKMDFRAIGSTKRQQEFAPTSLLDDFDFY